MVLEKSPENYELVLVGEIRKKETSLTTNDIEG